jgi:hypothetical protein
MIDIDLLLLFHLDGFDPFDQHEDSNNDTPEIELKLDSNLELKFLQSSHSCQSSSSFSSSSCFDSYHDDIFSNEDSMSYDLDDMNAEVFIRLEGKTAKETESAVLGQVTQSCSSEICRPKGVREGKVVKRDHPAKNFARNMRRTCVLWSTEKKEPGSSRERRPE